MPTRTLPLIGIPSCVRSIHERAFHTVNERYTSAVIDAVGGLPVLIPAIGPMADCGAILDRLDGILLTGSPSNVEPHHYGGPPSREGTLHDPDRDATTLPLIREAVRRDMPILAICRGIQELNVALGGTLHTEVHRQPGRLDHRSIPQLPYEEKYGPRHPVLVTSGGRLAALVGPGPIDVNSLHWQEIDRPAERLTVEGRAPDGTIEAVSAPNAPGFVLGLQWHPEWRYAENPASMAIFRAFGDACRAHQQGLRKAA